MGTHDPTGEIEDHMTQTQFRLTIGVGVASVAAALLAVSLFTQTAGAHDPTTNPTPDPDGAALAVAAGNDLGAMVLQVPAPSGFSLVRSQVVSPAAADISETLVVGEVKFHSPDRSAITVLLITGGEWSQERELAVGGGRLSSIVTVGQSSGVIVEGDHSSSLSWPASGDLIFQVVQRGGTLSRSELIDYATVITEATE